jgi:phosphoribosylformimino-5-aminoimidazole carboxamide ribotide isomerase
MPVGTRLIPVIDLMGGQVVRGVRGDRQAYRPIVSALCRSSDPTTVARVLVEHCAARELYVADLDALTGGAAQIARLRELLQALPEVDELWIDAGFADADDAAALMDAMGRDGERVVPVHGSESLRSRQALAGLGARGVLSLDRRDGRRLDAAGCWDAPELWPQRVIVMTLERVGSGAGPDLQTLGEVRAKSPRATLIGAGGLRTPADLERASEAGAAAWLPDPWARLFRNRAIPREPGCRPTRSQNRDTLSRIWRVGCRQTAESGPRLWHIACVLGRR